MPTQKSAVVRISKIVIAFLIDSTSACQAAYYAANKGKIRASYAANREKIRACYAANREKNLAYQATYYAANKEKIAAYQTAYRAANRGAK